ncbi:PD-(D/E)XK nuclease family protein [Mycobacterium sp.]|uniref:CRISPR-associated protein Cas4 n=1 Tax=Mycobacterium sp. TaxID=1785 RepID=UPI0031DDF24C
MEIIKNKVFSESEHSDYAYVSDIDFCMRKLYYKRFLQSVHYFETEINFSEGNAIHEVVQKIFKDDVGEKYNMRVFNEVTVNSNLIHGRIDVLMANNKEVFIIELKSTKMLPSKPYSHHISQLNTYMNFYMKGKRKVRAFLLYIEKTTYGSNSPMREFEIKYSYEKYINVMQRAQILNKYLTQHALPPAEAKTVKTMAWECRYCSYFLKCSNNENIDIEGDIN